MKRNNYSRKTATSKKRKYCIRRNLPQLFKSIRNRSAEALYRLFRLPVNLYFNFRLLPFSQAVRLPFFIGYGVAVREIHRGTVLLSADNVSKYMISIGRGGSEGIPVLDRGGISIAPGARITFQGRAQFHKGSRIFLGDQAEVMIGDGFSANRNFLLYYDSRICFGRDCMLGWNVQIFDLAAHRVFQDGREVLRSCEITVGDHVWIGAETRIVRGTVIGSHSVVAYGSTVTGGTFGTHVLLGGYPAKILRESVDWEK